MGTNHGERRRGAIGVVQHQGRYLVIQRPLHLEAGGAYCFPGGHIADNESSQAAVVRELQEELGVQARVGQRLWQSVTEWNVALDWWEVTLPDPQLIQANAAEVAQVLWLTEKEMRQLAGLLSSNLEFLDRKAT